MKEKKNIFIKSLKWFIFFLSLLFIIKVIEVLYKNELDFLDLQLYHLISISPVLTNFMKILTTLGSAYIIIPLTIILFINFFKKQEKYIAVLIPLNLCCITTLNIIIKNIVQRPRPLDISLIEEFGYSFPSGHSMVSMAFYGFLIYLIHRYMKSRRLSFVLNLIFFSIIFLIGYSRIYLGVHYASDVLTGFVISISYLIVFTSIISKRLPKK